MISYPYFIVVVGMGPIRQAAAIGFFMLSLFAFINNKTNKFILYNFISSLLHFHQYFLVVLFYSR